MRDEKLERLFDRYRTKGDPSALAEVFDATAPELLRIAANLVRGPQEADDLLQATYLTAIERAEHWDSGRRLVPWLLGILVRHAHEARRGRARTPDPGRLAERESDDPADDAARSEASEALARTLAALPSPYREVLEPFVREGRPPAEIAATIGRAPGTVRMQIHRGLDLLRKALPAGLALGALVTNAGPGLGAVRRSVLARAAERAPELAAAAATSTSAATVVGILTMKKAVLVAVSVAVVSSLAWLAYPGAETGSEPLARESAGGVDALDALERPSAHLDVPAANAESAPRAPEPVAAATEEILSAYERALCGLTGRVAEEDGTPVAGVGIALHEMGLERLQSAPDEVFERAITPDWVVARSVTDEDGRFRLHGARAHALHGIGIDLGGERPAFQLVDVTLNPGEETDVGTLTLPATLPVRGRVADATGAPIAGVRVRAARLSGRESSSRFSFQNVEWIDFAALRADTPVFAGQSLVQTIVEVPESTARLEASFPIATTTTDADGAFELPGAPVGATVFVDHPGWVPSAVAPGVAIDGVRELGTVRLALGTSVTGKVVDAANAVVTGAEVRAGGLFDAGSIGIRAAVLASSARTDAEGAFTLTGVREDGEVVVAARRSDASPWVMATPRDAGFVVLTLPESYTVEVALEATDGTALDEAELALVRPSILGGLVFGPLLASQRTYGRIERLAPGRYAIHDVQRGSYVVRGRAPGFVLAEERARARARAKPVTLVFEPGRELAVRVVDGASGAPVERASVALMQTPEHALRLARGTSDVNGTALLGPVALTLPEKAHLRIEHPLYATRDVALAPRAEEVAVELEAGGTLLLRVRYDGGPPPAPVTLDMDREVDGAHASDLSKRFGVTDAEGVIRVAHLAPGEWRWMSFRRYLDDNVFALVSGETSPVFLRSGRVVIRPGETSEVELDLSGTDDFLDVVGGSAGARGRITLDGEGVAELSYILQRQGGSRARWGATDPEGYFELTRLNPGRYKLSFFDETVTESGARVHSMKHGASFDLEPGETRVIDVDWHTTRVSVVVTGAQGGPVGSAWVSASGADAENRSFSAGGETDAQGRAMLELKGGGRFDVLVTHPTGSGNGELRLELGANDPVAIRLAPGVPCGGTAHFPADFDASDVFIAMLHFTSKADARLARSVQIDARAGAVPFTIEGLPPGDYTVSVIGIGVWLAPVDVTLPPGGDTALELELR